MNSSTKYSGIDREKVESWIKQVKSDNDAGLFLPVLETILSCLEPEIKDGDCPECNGKCKGHRYGLGCGCTKRRKCAFHACKDCGAKKDKFCTCKPESKEFPKKGNVVSRHMLEFEAGLDITGDPEVEDNRDGSVTFKNKESDKECSYQNASEKVTVHYCNHAPKLSRLEEIREKNNPMHSREGDVTAYDVEYLLSIIDDYEKRMAKK